MYILVIILMFLATKLQVVAHFSQFLFCKENLHTEKNDRG